MASIPQLSPSEITTILSKRLSSTNDLFHRRNPDDIEQEKVIFFKYYFDFSSAIEYCLRGIIFEYSKMPLVGKCIEAFVQPGSTTRPYFLKEDEFTAIINQDRILDGKSLDEFCSFASGLVNVMNFNFSNYSFNDYEITKEKYNQIRKVRNTIAHGLKALESSIDYSHSQLLDFIYIYYLLFKYYENSYHLNEFLE